ncbi:hypothetical protein [uncultured Shewanella sp.]|uniref:hypothetical protein n=1 Tax=uncultured Shewanella sp. TaxID=173975 RepID=UPI00260AB3A8|nr:hypothetical protein [uncultured Shewanella sp.]
MYKGIVMICCIWMSWAVQGRSVDDITATKTEHQPVIFDFLMAINTQFRQTYNEAVLDEVQQIKAGKIPVMIVSSGYLTFYYQGKRRQEKILSSQFHEVKAINHIVLGIYVYLSGLTEGELSAGSLLRLEAKKDQITKILNLIKKQPSKHYQLSMFTLSLRYLNSLIETGHYSYKGLKDYVQTMRSEVDQSFKFAAKSQLDLIHHYVSLWKNNMSVIDWLALKVVICASHQARYGELSYSYFSRLLNEKPTIGALGEEQIIYSESRYSEEEALKLLSRHIIDQRIGQDFFNDPFRMQKDLLIDVTESYLKRILPSMTERSLQDK